MSMSVAIPWKPWKRKHRSKPSFDIITPVTSNTSSITSIKSEPPGRTSFGTGSLKSTAATLVGPAIDPRFFDEQRTSLGIDATYRYPWSVHDLRPHAQIQEREKLGREVENLEPQPIIQKTLIDRPPFPRYGHTLSSDESRFILFGGVVDNRRTNDVYSIDSVDLSYQRLQTIGDKPYPRCGHTGVLYWNSLIVWGGETRRKPNDAGALDRSVYMLGLGSFRVLCTGLKYD